MSNNTKNSSNNMEGAGGTPVAKIIPKKVPANEQAKQPPVQAPPAPAQAQQAESEFAGLGHLLGGVLKPDDTQQKPDLGMAETFGRWRKEVHDTPRGQKAPGLFDAMDAPLRGLGAEDLRFANEVDAALSRRPRFGVRLLSLTVAFMFLILIIWAAFSSLDEVTHAEGQVVGSQRTQTIQNLEGGIIRSINVHEGEIVEKGAVLAQLDNQVAHSSYRDSMSKAVENSLALIRLEAELTDREPEYPKDLRRWLTTRIGVPIDQTTLARAREMQRDDANTYKSRQDLLSADLEGLSSQLQQRLQEVEEEEARLKQLRQSLDLAVQQRDTGAELLRRRNFAKMEYLNLESRVVDLKGQIEQLASSIPKARAAAEEIRKKMDSRYAEQHSNISQEISKRRLELTSLKETLSAGGDRVTRTELHAPVRGTIKQVYLNTVGGVVKPGEPIMDLVPLDDTLLVEARVRPQDVAFLRPGQDVMVKISAYDFSIYGGLPGKLESISADTIEDRRGDFHYLVKVRTKDNALAHNNELLPIIPGMMATADILIGKKTVLDYLMKPILKAKQNALRER